MAATTPARPEHGATSARPEHGATAAAPEGMLRITQVRSVIGRTQDQRATVRSLGLKRIRHTVVQPDRPEIRGMLRKVPHLVSFEPVDGSEATTDEEVEAR